MGHVVVTCYMNATSDVSLWIAADYAEALAWRNIPVLRQDKIKSRGLAETEEDAYNWSMVRER